MDSEPPTYLKISSTSMFRTAALLTPNCRQWRQWRHLAALGGKIPWPPPIACPNSSCESLSEITTISTEWPLLLRIDPICRSYNPDVDPPMAPIVCPLTMDMGPVVQYELIARVIYVPPMPVDTESVVPVGHYVTKTRLNGQTYLYNDLRREGVLNELGPLYLLEEFDPNTAYVLYLRTSKASADFEKLPSQTKIVIDIPDDSDNFDAELAQMLIDSITSPTKKPHPSSETPLAPPSPLENSQDRFYTPSETGPMLPLIKNLDLNPDHSLAETNSQTPSPVCCYGCGMQKPEGDDIDEEVQCEKCRKWSHIACLPSGVDWNADDVRFICEYCRKADPLAEILWRGKIVMFPDPKASDWKAGDVLWYPARFMERQKNAPPQQEYEFQWFECTIGAVYQPEKDPSLPQLFARRFCPGAQFIEEVDGVDLTAEQLGTVHIPFYMFPDHPDHQNPEVTSLFEAATPNVAKILATFDSAHPVIASYLKHFKKTKPHERRRGAGDWMRTCGLVPTPEMEEVLLGPLNTLLGHVDLSHLFDPERNERVMGVGSALLQILAVQHELGEELNLNGDFLDDLVIGRVVRCPSDGPAALAAMFAAISQKSKSGAQAREMVRFNNLHSFYDPDYRPPTFRRDDPSIFPVTAPILVTVKRKGDPQIQGEKPPKKAKASKQEMQKRKKKSVSGAKPGGNEIGRRLRSRRDK
ncbi:hypothetical protein K438DRAFT_1786981 [Mycena galopus ATCC 62051]|nr:hypothetical protein K438DRAFT_1786981 [Mycena galopus ATCC 62051]